MRVTEELITPVDKLNVDFAVQESDTMMFN